MDDILVLFVFGVFICGCIASCVTGVVAVYLLIDSLRNQSKYLDIDRDE